MTESDHVRWLSNPQLQTPAVIAGFSGWNDAADAAILQAFDASEGTTIYSFGNMVVSDPMGNWLKCFSTLSVMVTLVYGRPYAAERDMLRMGGELFTLGLFALLGMYVMISGNNFLIIYMGLELLTLSSYALVALRRDDSNATEAAMKYFVLGALASGFLLYGLSMLYGATGTLDLSSVFTAVATGHVKHQVLVLGVVFVVSGLAFKLGAAPFHMWVPDVYQGAPTAVALMIGGAPKLAVFAMMMRLLVDGLLPLAIDWQQMLMVLAVANLVIFAGILGLAYLLFRRAWGAVGALGASVVFVTVFAFCPLLDINIFNYALPYSHEATHGMLVMVGLIVAVGRWVEVPRVRWCGVAGGLVGLALVLKPEFIFAAAVLVVTAVILRRRQWPQRGGMSVLVFALAALVPTAVFTCYFMRYFPPLEALSAAGRAWWSLLIMPDILAKNYQLSFIGLDSPWANLAQHLHKTALAVTCIGVLGVLVAVGLLRSGASKLVVLSFATAAALVAGLSADWGSSGRSLLGLLLCYVTFRFWRGGQSASKAGSIREPQAGWRILITAGAVAMMARMFLKGRIVQFGFFQAALAGMVATAIICSEAAEWLPGTRWRRAAVAFSAAALFAPGLWWAGKRAHDYYSWQTLPVADARDRFYHFEPEIEALLEGTYDRSKNLFQAETLLVKCPSKYESETVQDNKQEVGK